MTVLSCAPALASVEANCTRTFDNRNFPDIHTGCGMRSPPPLPHYQQTQPATLARPPGSTYMVRTLEFGLRLPTVRLTIFIVNGIPMSQASKVANDHTYGCSHYLPRTRSFTK